MMPVGATVISSAVVGCTSPGADNEPSAPAPSAWALTPGSGDAGRVNLGEAREVATGLDAPWSIVFVGDTALVSKRDSGRILDLTGDGSTRTVHTLENIVRPDSGGGMGPEGGLPGLATGPADGLYVYSTGAEGNRIQRFEVGAAPSALRGTDCGHLAHEPRRRRAQNAHFPTMHRTPHRYHDLWSRR
jgi:glucose/arabinose dehydrogenase